MERLLKLRQGMTMADIGTGSGVLLDCFSRAVGPRGRVWATRRFGFRLAVVAARARTGVSAPMQQVVRFYSSLARSLKPDGRMVILDWSENNPVVDPQHGSLRSEEVVEQMSRAGFVLVQQKELRMTPSGCQEVPRFLRLPETQGKKPFPVRDAPRVKH